MVDSKRPERIIADYREHASEASLPSLCRDLFARQMILWQAMGEAYGNLRTALRREIACDGTSFRLQFNPGRVNSVEARVDAASIEKRPCFLCADHLPPEQQAVSYRDEFLILCNPFPIFEPHFTIVHRSHRPQLLAEHIPIFLRLARDLSPDFSVFYNGPRCGASAPDHLHFQACPAGAIPMEGEVVGIEASGARKIFGVSLFEYRRACRCGLLLAGTEGDGVAAALAAFLEAMGPLADDGQEPMVNVIASFREGCWRVFVFPRRKHRPDAFFLEGADRRAVTPGAVEMGGLIVTARKSDYLQLNEGELSAIFADVSVGGETLKGILDVLPADYR